MTDKYSLDLAFSSSIPIGYAKKNTSMLALGYGWAKSPSTSEPWWKDGEKAEHVEPGAIVYFIIYDGQPGPYAEGQIPIITKLELKFTASSPEPPSTPFVDLENHEIANPITICGKFPFTTTTQGSTGCNIVGYHCMPSLPPLFPGYYTVNSSIPKGVVYHCTVEFIVICGDGATKKFKVDPEMIVGGGG